MEPVPVSDFELEKHQGPYEDWPATTRLLFKEQFTGTQIPAHVIEAQFRLGSRFLIATSDDCPFEEATGFFLLDGDFKVLASLKKGTPYATWRLQNIEPLSPDQLRVSFGESETWILSIRSRRPFFFGSLLSLKRETRLS